MCVCRLVAEGPIVTFDAFVTKSATGVGSESHITVVAGTAISPFVERFHVEVRLLLGRQGFVLKQVLMAAFTIKAVVINMDRVTEQDADYRCIVVNVATMVFPPGQTAESRCQDEERADG